MMAKKKAPKKKAVRRANGRDTTRGEQFLYRQAEILDASAGRTSSTCFADDGVYWMPPEPSHTTWDGMPAIFAEDKSLMTVRMKRVLHPDAWSQKTALGHEHVVGNVVIEKESPAAMSSRARASHDGAQARRTCATSPARTSSPQEDQGRLRIKLQRVDMTNAQRRTTTCCRLV